MLMCSQTELYSLVKSKNNQTEEPEIKNIQTSAHMHTHRHTHSRLCVFQGLWANRAAVTAGYIYSRFWVSIRQSSSNAASLNS